MSFDHQMTILVFSAYSTIFFMTVLVVFLGGYVGEFLCDFLRLLTIRFKDWRKGKKK